MLLSKACIYGLRASLYLASQEESEYTPISDISKKLAISFHFLTKILQQLTASELVESYKGPKGGVRLSQKGRNATLYDFVVTIDGNALFTQCALGLPGCGVQKPCPLHEYWSTHRASIKEMLERATLDKLGRQGKENHLRISDNGDFVWG